MNRLEWLEIYWLNVFYSQPALGVRSTAGNAQGDDITSHSSNESKVTPQTARTQTLHVI